MTHRKPACLFFKVGRLVKIVVGKYSGTIGTIRSIVLTREFDPLVTVGFLDPVTYNLTQSVYVRGELELLPSDSEAMVAYLRMLDSGGDRKKADPATEKSAALTATQILKSCKLEQHAHLDKKGFPDVRGMVWYPDENTNLLAIPMRVGKELTGVQLISRDGEKKFLDGSRTVGAEFLIDGGGIDVFVTDYTTGLAVSVALRAALIKHRVRICFSASNLQATAKKAGAGFVIADNDESKTGEKAAIESGLPYWMPPTVGTDFNDYWREVGTLKAAMVMRKFYQGLAIHK
jgi:phage/plasmid primase-like uncharacterized protein